MEKSIRRSIVSGKTVAPPSAPAAHRAILAASLAEGQSVLSRLPASQGIMATIEACNSAGADIVAEGGVADVFGNAAFQLPSDVDCAESNTTLKLLLPFSAMQESKSVFSGSGKLQKSPLLPYVGYLSRLGASCDSPSGFLPLSVNGPLLERELVYPTPLGTQFLSGLLLAAPLLDVDTEIGIEGQFANRENVDFTISLMKQCGINFDVTDEDFISIPGAQEYSPLPDFEMPGSAYLSSFILLAGAVAGKVRVEKMPGATAIESLLSSFGAHCQHGQGSLGCSAGSLCGQKLEARELGQYLPHALVLASLCSEQTEIAGIGALKGRKEANLRSMVRQLSKMGAQVKEEEGNLTVSGGKLSGAAIDPEGDPAVAMACTVAALAADGPSTLSGAECVEKSHPGFFRDLSSLGAIIR